MSMHERDFAYMIGLRIKQYKWYKTAAHPVPPAALNAELAAIVTALNADTSTHDKTITTPPAALKINHEKQTRPTNDFNLLINKGKAGNLSTSIMAAVIDGVVGVASKPFNTAVPYAHANATPPVVGTVCNCTTGLWIGLPSSYTYAWYRTGTVISGATAANYTLIAADIGGKHITCVVTAVNGVGTTAAPPSNAIAT